MDGPDSLYTIHVNGKPTYTLSVEEGEYYTVLDTSERSVTITHVELFDPEGVLLARFDFACAFAVPKDEVGQLIVHELEEGYSMMYYACQTPGYVEERRDFYCYDVESQRLRAADHIGDGVLQFRE